MKTNKMSVNDFRNKVNSKKSFNKPLLGTEFNRTFFRLTILSVVFIILALAQINQLSSIGITPGRTTVDFSPGLSQDIQFSIVNTEHKDMNVVLFVRGDFNESILLEKAFVSLSASENSKELSYRFTLPNRIDKPGKYVAEIVAMEVPADSEEKGAFVGATVAVASQLYIYVAYPDKYLEGEVNIVLDDSGKVVFFVPIVNRGDLDIVSARAIIDVYTPLNEKVATIETTPESLLSLQRVELAAEWIPNVNPGKYLAVVTVLYDNEALELHKEFSIGESLVDIEEVYVKDFQLGEIAKFNALINNKWSSEIKDAFLNILVYNDEGQIMADFKSPTYDLAPLSKSEMVSYWDTAGVHRGEYDGKLILRYGEKSTDKNIHLKVSDSEIEISGLTGKVSVRSSGGKSDVSSLLVIGIIVLVVVNIIWFVVVKKLMKRKK